MRAVALNFGKDRLIDVDESAFRESYGSLCNIVGTDKTNRALHFFRRKRPRYKVCFDARKRRRTRNHASYKRFGRFQHKFASQLCRGRKRYCYSRRSKLCAHFGKRRRSGTRRRLCRYGPVRHSRRIVQRRFRRALRTLRSG